MRRRHVGARGREGYGLVVGATLLAGGVASLSGVWLPGVWAALVTASAAVMSGVFAELGVQRHGSAVATAVQWPSLLYLDSGRRLPLVGTVDPITLGVHRAAGGPGMPADLPPFVRRDVSDQLEECLAPGRFVLLVGESTAGKTRIAYEAMLARVGGWPLIVPNEIAGVPAALDATRTVHRSAVVWLDDLEKFLGTDGLSPTHIQNLLHGGRRPHLILATLRAEECTRLTDAVRDVGSDRMNVDRSRGSEEVLRLAEQIYLARAWSPREKANAQKDVYTADPRIREALKRIDRFGLAEYLAAGPQLLQHWWNAWAVGNRPRGAALVAAAVLARRCAIHRPLPATLLARVAQPILEQHGGTRLRPESLTSALEWATTPVHATSSPLVPADDDGYTAFDYLIDALPKDSPPPAALDALLSFATEDEAIDLAELAWGWRCFAQAHAAWQRALAHPDHERRAYALDNLASMISVRRGDDQARDFLISTVRERTEQLGSEHLETLDARLMLAGCTGWGTDVHEGIRQAQELLPLLHDAGEGGAAQLLRCRGLIAWRRGTLGEWPAVEPELNQQIQEWAALPETDATQRLQSIFRHAYCLSRIGRRDEQIGLLRELRNDPRFARTKDREDTLAQLAYALQEAERYEEAAELFRRLRRTVEGRYGDAHVAGLFARFALASCLGHLGDPAEAVRILDGAVRLQETTSHETDLLHVLLRRRLHTWTGMAGHPHTAASRLHDLAKVSETALGQHDHATLACRSRAAHWTAAAGDVPSGIEELTHLLPEFDRRFGPDDPEARASRKSLDHWHTRIRHDLPPAS
ncbi:tetratricopeptide repeat protein [Streptomyces sp. NBC_00201]|uniref:tetratricopeptide repeat protein n=1 Tax=Streptomyces sp. NBC_00201 TaxID=2975679 RepID=UPI00224ECF60|nr:tetratricopeptide repeat protein [Streptomyces sp. NBC_00201]MCX5247116.1 tetratricopeptide repeat protein [Streptomyces sp. NBC_00201]